MNFSITVDEWYLAFTVPSWLIMIGGLYLFGALGLYKALSTGLPVDKHNRLAVVLYSAIWPLSAPVLYLNYKYK